MPYSVEIFAPKTTNQIQGLVDKLAKLKALGLSQCSITQSLKDAEAVNSTYLLKILKQQLNLDFVMHLSATASTPDGRARLFEVWRTQSVSKVLCLRGDLPQMQNQRQSTVEENSFSALKLIAEVRIAKLTPWASAYPTPHHKSRSKQAGLDWTRRKLDAGAATLVTQFCFDTDCMLDWASQIKQTHPNVKILFGIVPLSSIGQIEKLHALNQIPVPAQLREFCERYANAEGSIPTVAAQKYLWQTCRKLKSEGYQNFHFYTFNRLSPTDWAFQQTFTNNLQRQVTDVATVKNAA